MTIHLHLKNLLFDAQHMHTHCKAVFKQFKTVNALYAIGRTKRRLKANTNYYTSNTIWPINDAENFGVLILT